MCEIKKKKSIKANQTNKREDEKKILNGFLSFLILLQSRRNKFSDSFDRNVVTLIRILSTYT